MAIVKIPTPLRKFTENNDEIAVKSTNVFDALKEIESKYPNFLCKICDVDGNIYPYLNIFVNDKNINELKGVKTEIKNNDEIYIIPAIAGGDFFNKGD